MDLSAAGEPPGSVPARLTILALRAAVPAPAAVRTDRVITRPPRAVGSTDEAVRALAALPKPVDCWADLEGDTLVITAVPIPALSPDDPAWLAAPPVGPPDEHAPTLGALYTRDLRQRYGDAYAGLPILCVGPGEALVVPVADFEAWLSEYHIWKGEMSVELPAALLAHGGEVARLAREAGVVQGAVFGPVRDDGVMGRLHIARIAAGGRGVNCVRCHDRPAQFEVTWYDARAGVRHLCQRCLDEELPVQHFDAGRDVARMVEELAELERAGDAERLAELAEREARTWALRVTPPPIRAFIEKHRRP